MRGIPTSQIRAPLFSRMRLAAILFVTVLTASFTMAMVVGWQMIRRLPVVAVAGARPTETVARYCGWSGPPASYGPELLALAILGLTVLFLVLGRQWTRRMVKQSTYCIGPPGSWRDA